MDLICCVFWLSALPKTCSPTGAVNVTARQTVKCCIINNETDVRKRLCSWRNLTVTESGAVNVTAGQTVGVKCRGPSNISILAVYLTRLDLDPQYVYVFRDNRSDTENQHPDFINRVELEDTQMKDGNVFLLLKNLRFNDTGMYKCSIIHRETNRTKRFNSKIYLTVTESGDGAGHTEDGGDKDGGGKDSGQKGGGDRNRHISLLLILSVVGLLLVAVIFLSCRNRCKNLNQRPSDEDVENPLQQGVEETRMEEGWMQLRRMEETV